MLNIHRGSDIPSSYALVIAKLFADFSGDLEYAYALLQHNGKDWQVIDDESLIILEEGTVVQWAYVREVLP